MKWAKTALAEAWAARSSVRKKERSFILKARQEAEKESAMKHAEKRLRREGIGMLDIYAEEVNSINGLRLLPCRSTLTPEEKSLFSASSRYPE
jgi:hypothetical protein